MNIASVRPWFRAHGWDLASLAASLVPAVIVIRMFLESALAPPGADPAHHATFTRWILDSQRAFVSYSQFPSGGSEFEYPSLFNVALALVVVGSGLDLFATMEAFVVALVILSPLMIWRFLRRFFNRGPFDTFVAVAMVSLNWFVLLKIARDGSYGEVLAAGVLLPLWLSFLWDRRDVLAASTLFAIVLSHNLTALLALGCFLALAATLAVQRNWTRIRRMVLAHAAVVVMTGALFWSVYASYLFPVASGAAGIFPTIDPLSYVVILSPILFAFGLAGAVLLARSQRGWFLGAWLLAYALLSRTTFASERIVREMSVPLAVGTAALAVYALKRIRQAPDAESRRWPIVMVAAIVVLTVSNGTYWLLINSEPETLDYLQPHKVSAYQWLARYSNRSESVLSLQSADPYLPVFVPNNVFLVVNLQQAETLSRADRELDLALVNALFNFENSTSRSLFAGFGIRWILLSTPFPAPTWLAPEDRTFIEQAWRLGLSSASGYVLRHEEGGLPGTTRIFQIVGSGG